MTIREFTDQDGAHWRVSERFIQDERCLIFQSDAIARRLDAFPPMWSDLSERHLRKLLQMATDGRWQDPAEERRWTLEVRRKGSLGDK
jgi:hypothetical protein